LLADTAKGPAVWAVIARKMGPQTLRMNLNTLVRHGDFGRDANREMVDYVAARLADPDEIRRSRQFPYRFLAAYMNANNEVFRLPVVSKHPSRDPCRGAPKRLLTSRHAVFPCL
jgi:60 kDa SS-A/Ro ribonucleoprotein